MSCIITFLKVVVIITVTYSILIKIVPNTILVLPRVFVEEISCLHICFFFGYNAEKPENNQKTQKQQHPKQCD